MEQHADSSELREALSSMLSNTIRFVLTVALVVLPLASCASAGGTSATTATRAPVMLAGPRPDFKLPSRPQEGRLLDMQIEVAIDATGRPDVSTLRVTGLGSGDNKDAVVTWITLAKFKPALQGGQPVAGVYRTRLEVRAKIIARE